MVLNVAPPVAPQCPVSQLGGRLCHSVIVEPGTSRVKELLLHQLGVQQTAHVALRGRDLVRQRTAIIFDYCWTPASILPHHNVQLSQPSSDCNGECHWNWKRKICMMTPWCWPGTPIWCGRWSVSSSSRPAPCSPRRSSSGSWWGPRSTAWPPLTITRWIFRLQIFQTKWSLPTNNTGCQ